MSSERRRVKVRSDVKMVSMHGERIRNEGEPVDLFGHTVIVGSGVQAVQMDDGRELLIAMHDLEVVT